MLPRRRRKGRTRKRRRRRFVSAMILILPLEAIYHRNSHHKTETRKDTDVIHQNDDGRTNMSPSPLQGAVSLTQGETQDLSLAIAETVSNAMSSVNTKQQVTHIHINNPQLNLTKTTEVANLTAHNVSMGGQQVIQPSTSSDGAESQQKTKNRPTDIPQDLEIQRIKDVTVSEIYTRTSGLIKTQFVDDIVKKIDAGQNWITVTGNGGDGKTTVAYMVLEEMMKQGKEVFRVKTVGDYYTITKNTDRCVIMMNDVIGTFALDTYAFSTWKPVLLDVMENMSTAEESGQPCGVICVFVQRSNILKEAECSFEKHKSSILGENAVSNLSRLPDGEQTAILNYHLNQKNIHGISEEEKEKLLREAYHTDFHIVANCLQRVKVEGKQDDTLSSFSPLLLRS
ncbi:uncharacterized protein LOC124286006 [Haliotis rubra]|uniref:uncharacterized protein LOC124286006 n=1 Tax=Haliotis rubra TaxID=36100 RepID=UPI001EE516DA|nr:uncharacterized protein LOC124286006 [Haliotis rubra]